MTASGQPRATVAEVVVGARRQAEWGPQPVWIFREKKYLMTPAVKEPRFLRRPAQRSVTYHTPLLAPNYLKLKHIQSPTFFPDKCILSIQPTCLYKTLPASQNKTGLIF